MTAESGSEKGRDNGTMEELKAKIDAFELGKYAT